MIMDRLELAVRRAKIIGLTGVDPSHGMHLWSRAQDRGVQRGLERSRFGSVDNLPVQVEHKQPLSRDEFQTHAGR